MEAISIEFTKQELDQFVRELFSMFRAELRHHYTNDPEDGPIRSEYDLAIADCIGETFVFTGEVD